MGQKLLVIPAILMLAVLVPYLYWSEQVKNVSIATVATTGMTYSDDVNMIIGNPVGGYLCPIAGKHHFIDSWGFPRSGGRTHKGQDMFGKKGTPLVAMVDGTLSGVRVGAGLGGTVLWLTSKADGSAWYYAHLDGFAPGIRNGLSVKQGQHIGFLGKTGNARTTPPHLHIQFRPNGRGGKDINNYSILRAACPKY